MDPRPRRLRVVQGWWPGSSGMASTGSRLGGAQPIGSRVNAQVRCVVRPLAGARLELGCGGEEKERKSWATGLRRGKEKGGGGLGRLGFWPMAHIGNNNHFCFLKTLCNLQTNLNSIQI
jgi:hypothetical protein